MIPVTKIVSRSKKFYSRQQDVTSSWDQIQKNRNTLYLELRNKVEARIGPADREMKLYQKQYDQEAQDQWFPETQAEFFRSALRAQLLLLGDFHALEQSQRTHIRILRKLIRYGKKPVIFLECLQWNHGPLIQKYLRQEISDLDFCKSIQWDESWGFPWEHYQCYFELAREHKLEIIGLSPRKAWMQTLNSRDEFACHVVGRYIIKDKMNASANLNVFDDNRQFVLIMGDLHLGQKRLPTQLKKKLGKNYQILRVLQNIDSLYWKLSRQNYNPVGKILRKNRQTFCVQSVAPWVKWQSYLHFLELKNEGDRETSLEATELVAHLVQVFNRDFNEQVKLDKLHVFHSDETGPISKYIRKLKSRQRAIVRTMMNKKRSFFDPQVEIGFVGRKSLNHSAEVAFAYFYYRLSGVRKLNWNLRSDFEKWIWFRALQYFGSKVINPHRKSATVQDMAKSMGQKNNGASRLAMEQKEREWAVLVGSQDSDVPTLSQSSKLAPQHAWLDAIELLGMALGEKMFLAMRDGLVSHDEIRVLLRQRLDIQDFQKFYYRTLRMFESVPEPFQSKDDQI